MTVRHMFICASCKRARAARDKNGRPLCRMWVRLVYGVFPARLRVCLSCAAQLDNEGQRVLPHRKGRRTTWETSYNPTLHCS